MDPRVSKPQRQVLDRIRGLLDDPSHSDVVIKCGSETFYAHKAILSASSPVLRESLSPGKWREGNRGVYEIGDRSDLDSVDPSNDPIAVQMMLQFIYSGDYVSSLRPYKFLTARKDRVEANKELDQPATSAPPSPVIQCVEVPTMEGGRLKLHVRMHALGDKYDMPELMTLAAEKFDEDSKDLHWDDDAFCEATTMAFTTGPDHNTELTKVINDACHRHELGGGLSEVMEDCVQALPKLAFGLYKRSREMTKGPNCGTCGEVEIRRCQWQISMGICNNPLIACKCLPDTQHCDKHVDGFDFFGQHKSKKKGHRHI